MERKQKVMGGGYYGKFGNTTGSGTSKDVSSNGNSKSDNSKTRVVLPKDDSQLKHIFGEREGHLPDTKLNRKILSNLANDTSKFIGKDKYGNYWHAKITLNGGQYWVVHRKGVIQNGGFNKVAKVWHSGTGFSNPFKKRK